MKNLPSKRASRANLAREQTRKSRFMGPVPADNRSGFARPYWTFSDLVCRRDEWPAKSDLTMVRDKDLTC